MSGTIQNIKIFPRKGSAAVELREGRLIENLGLEGDFHAKGGERQISLLFAATPINDRHDTQGEPGFCISRFKENINILFSKPVLSKAAKRFEIGEAILEISGETKPCHEECSLYKIGKPCSLAGLVFFAKVLKGGIISIGDRVSVNS